MYYTDIFDGTTNNNWNQVAGGWTFSPTQNAVLGLGVGVEATLMLANVLNNTFGHTMRVFSLDTQDGTAYFYAMYMDANNWFPTRDQYVTTRGQRDRTSGSHQIDAQ